MTPLLQSLLLLVVLSSMTNGEMEVCDRDPTSLCRCTLSDGRVFDLTEAGSRDVNAPHFVITNKTADPKRLLQYNPCFGFKCGSDNKTADAAVCVIVGKNASKVGTQPSVVFKITDDGKMVAEYSNEHKTAYITFNCVTDAAKESFAMAKRSGSNPEIYDGVVISPVACLTSPSSDSVSPSLGDVLLIFLFVTLFAYLGLGVLYQGLVKKERGWGLLPNSTLWLALPGLIRDGFLFSTSCCRGRARGESYTNIR